MVGGEAETFGAMLRRYRQAAALSQEALAERAGLSAVTISALERGARRSPYLGTVELLATALALDAADRAALIAAARPSGGEPPRGGRRRYPGAAGGAAARAGAARPVSGRRAHAAGAGQRCCSWRASRVSARPASCRPRPSRPSPAAGVCWSAAASAAVGRSPTPHSSKPSPSTSRHRGRGPEACRPGGVRLAGAPAAGAGRRISSRCLLGRFLPSRSGGCSSRQSSAC